MLETIQIPAEQLNGLSIDEIEAVFNLMAPSLAEDELNSLCESGKASNIDLKYIQYACPIGEVNILIDYDDNIFLQRSIVTTHETQSLW